jgi:uncharacterized RDD family membrane protein YckC
MFCAHCGVALYEGAASCSACGRPVHAAEREAAPVAYAGFWLRAAAFVIDSLVLVIPSFLIFAVVVAFFGLQLPTQDATLQDLPMPRRLFFETYGVVLIVQWLYFAVMESSPWRGTLGNRALGIAVSDLEGRRISFGRASVRSFAKLLLSAAFMVGYLVAAFTEKRQALHDIVAKTLVVRMP